MDVRDNGVGMDEEQICRINERICNGVVDHETASISSGLGLHNVHMRLKMFYGGNSSVRFVADGEEGIVCRMTIDLENMQRKGR